VREGGCKQAYGKRFVVSHVVLSDQEVLIHATPLHSIFLGATGGISVPKKKKNKTMVGFFNFACMHQRPLSSLRMHALGLATVIKHALAAWFPFACMNGIACAN